MMWWWLSVAFAGDLPWVGDWALDPTQSDEGPQAIESLVRSPTRAGQAAAGMSPDPSSGQQTQADERQRLVKGFEQLLSRSGRIVIEDADDGVTVQYAGEDAVTLPFGRKWTKTKWQDTKVRLRAFVGNVLVLERRVAGATVTEKFLPIREPGEAAVVVRIDGAGVQGREFRRVYRAVTTP